MPGVKLLSSLPLNQIGYAPSRPQPGTVTQHLAAFFQSATQLFQLGRQHHVVTHRKGARVAYLTSEQFTNEYIDGIQNNQLTRFRKKSIVRPMCF